jgi:D-alanine-D-alanine ligase
LVTEAGEVDFYDADTKLEVDSRGAVTVSVAELAPDVLDKITGDARTLWDGLGHL